jgi:3-deoxy-D-manno-octulosonic-acid transferase
LAETEFWPNLLRSAHEMNAKVAVVNARISDRSFPRYKMFRGLLAKVLGNIDLFLAQTPEDSSRLDAIGAEKARIQITGNLKFEAPTLKPSGFVEQLRSAVSGPVLVCGSTVEGEESLLLPAFGRLLAAHPNAVVVLAPRHPERFPAVAGLLASSGLMAVKRSEWHGEALAAQIFLLDSIGELAAVYEIARAAFVGGSLVPRGGHNILEPARFAVPIFVGKYTQNFRDIIAIFRESDSIHIIEPGNAESDLATAFDSKWHEMGTRGRAVLDAYAGALQRTVDALEVLLWMPSSIQARYQQVQK